MSAYGEFRSHNGIESNENNLKFFFKIKYERVTPRWSFNFNEKWISILITDDKLLKSIRKKNIFFSKNAFSFVVVKVNYNKYHFKIKK